MNKIVLCLGVLVLAAWSAPAPAQNDAVFLENVGMLQFNAGEYAVNTRTPDSIPRLTCAYNPLNDDSYLPTSVTCKNKGYDDSGSIMWKCKADMDASLDFDNIQISCEGYNYPGDKMVRAGSCALTYTLKLTSAGVREPQEYRHQVPPPKTDDYYHHQEPRQVHVRNHQENYYKQPVEVKPLWTFTNVLILVFVVVLVVRCCCKKSKKAPINNNNNTYYEKKQEESAYNNESQPSAPYSNEATPSGYINKRSGYAETVSR